MIPHKLESIFPKTIYNLLNTKRLHLCIKQKEMVCRIRFNLLFIMNKFSVWVVCFSHIFGGGYAAGYYAYLWTQMLADDGYQWFVEQGGLTRENGQRFREAILSRGNSTDLAELYRQWRGHDPKIEPMLENRGLSE
ncbi:M3 family metallopeptidase [Raoultella ornithinolytica]|uniref:M3 family metallopeptidase n=1 Tax=Raoultella ornithinolytica TaxID=54291 RepID=UPI003F658EFC